MVTRHGGRLSCDRHDLLFPIRVHSNMEFNNHSFVYSLSLLSWASSIVLRRITKQKCRKPRKFTCAYFTSLNSETYDLTAAAPLASGVGRNSGIFKFLLKSNQLLHLKQI